MGPTVTVVNGTSDTAQQLTVELPDSAVIAATRGITTHIMCFEAYEARTWHQSCFWQQTGVRHEGTHIVTVFYPSSSSWPLWD